MIKKSVMNQLSDAQVAANIPPPKIIVEGDSNSFPLPSQDGNKFSLDYVRLECLKLVHTHAKGLPEILKQAEAYTNFVVNGCEQPAPDKEDK